MSRLTDPLEIGKGYARTELAKLWGLAGYQGIGRGVFTPKGTRQIFLFVTRQRESWMTKYNNFLDNDLLFWDGEEGHRSDDRIANAKNTGDEIHLFYRERRPTPFTYYGGIIMLKRERHAASPSEFVFQLISAAPDISLPDSEDDVDEAADYLVLSEAGVRSIDRKVSRKSRGIAQRFFRGNLLRLWQGSCAVTGVREGRVLRSSHIKPWAKADVIEKVDRFNGLLLVPNLDGLLNEGLISFRNDGRIMIGSNWQPDDQRRMHVTPDMRLNTVHPESRQYLEFHREIEFEKPRIARA